MPMCRPQPGTMLAVFIFSRTFLSFTANCCSRSVSRSNEILGRAISHSLAAPAHGRRFRTMSLALPVQCSTIDPRAIQDINNQLFRQPGSHGDVPFYNLGKPWRHHPQGARTAVARECTLVVHDSVQTCIPHHRDEGMNVDCTRRMIILS